MDIERVLVTGAAGFIGSTVVDELLAEDCTVIGVDNFDTTYNPAVKKRNLAEALKSPRFSLYEVDVRDDRRMKDIFAREKPQGTVHLAACVGNRRSLTAADDYDATNVRGTENLLAACSGSTLSSLVFISTVNIYDDLAEMPFREGWTPDAPRTPYAASKKEAELRVQDAVSKQRLPGTILRLSTVYGPRQRPDMGMTVFCRALHRGEPVPVFGEGGEKRDSVFIEDGAAAIVAALKNPQPGEVINISSGSSITTMELLDTMSRLLGLRLRVRFQPADSRDTRVLWCDITKAERLLDWTPLTSLEAGLALFGKWWRRMDTP